MRIIAGELGGRQFEAPHGHRTHPMSDKARGGLFSVLDDIEGLTVLDAFAGSGALSFEAVSRGASHATAIDEDKAAIRAIKSNISSLGLENKIKVTQANVSSWSDNNQNQSFDLLFCDPPYERLQIALVQILIRHLQPGGLLVLSWPANVELPEFIGVKLLKQKDYGDAKIAFYQR